MSLVPFYENSEEKKNYIKLMVDPDDIVAVVAMEPKALLFTEGQPQLTDMCELKTQDMLFCIRLKNGKDLFFPIYWYNGFLEQLAMYITQDERILT